jgi:chromosome partitioning protein
VRAKKAIPSVDLATRTVPIVSVLSLKGGVGKTTITAMLGLALACKGWRVLYVDLDLQGSLSSLFLSEETLVGLSRAGRMARDLLSAHARPAPKAQPSPTGARARRLSVRDFAVGLDQLPGRAQLLATTDKLAYTELSLTYEWLLKLQSNRAAKGPARRDVRLALRKAIHGTRNLKRQHDIVLMDCPPMLTLSCVNALAASDYVLVPVTPSRKGVERVPSMLRGIRDVREQLNHHLDVLGVVPNRTNGEELTMPEQRIITSQAEAWHGIWGKPVPVYSACIPDRTQVRDAENDFPPRDADAIVFRRFMQLAADVVRDVSPVCGPSMGPWSPPAGEVVE